MNIRAYSLALCLLLLAGWGPMEPESAQATVAITPNVKTDACASGYIRVTPNMCQVSNWSGTFISIGIADHGLCKDLDISLTVPSTTRAAIVIVRYIITTRNAVESKGVNVRFSSNSSCSTNVLELRYRAYEETAKVAGSDLSQGASQFTVPVTNGHIYIQPTFIQQSTDSVQGYLVQVLTIGYYD